jgi:hypothetical protein
MTTEPNLLSADGIPLRFGVTLKADSCATGHANIVVKTPGNDNQGWAITALPNPFAIGYARAINDIVGKVLPRETANPNFCPEAVCTNTENMGNQTVSIDTCRLIWHVFPEVWTPVEPSIKNQDQLLAVQIADLLNKQNLVLSLGITANNRQL